MSEYLFSHLSEISGNMFGYRVITVREYMNLFDTGKVNTKLAHQRGEVASWKTAENMDKFLDTVIRGLPLPASFVTQNGESLDLHDGLQRLTAFRRVFNGIHIQPSSFQTKAGQVESLNPDICDISFDLWAKKYQEAFLNYPLLFVECEFTEEGDVVVLFVRLNKNGVPLTTSQAYRGTFVDKLKALSAVINHPVFEAVKLDTAKAELLTMQLINGLTTNPNYASKSLVQWFAKTEFKTSLLVDLDRAVNRLNSIVEINESLEADSPYRKTFNKVLKAVHVESILHVLAQNGLQLPDSADIHANLCDFFSMERSERSTERIAYNEASNANTASNANITTRHEIMTAVLCGTAVKANKKVESVPAESESKADKTEESGTAESAFILECQELFGTCENHGLSDYAKIEAYLNKIEANDYHAAVDEKKHEVIRFLPKIGNGNSTLFYKRILTLANE